MRVKAAATLQVMLSTIFWTSTFKQSERVTYLDCTRAPSVPRNGTGWGRAMIQSDRDVLSRRIESPHARCHRSGPRRRAHGGRGGGELQQRGEKKRHFCQLIICMFKKWNDENILNQYLVQKNHSQKGFKNFSLSARQRDSARHLATLPVNMSHPNITTLLTHKSRSQQRCTCSWSC